MKFQLLEKSCSFLSFILRNFDSKGEQAIRRILFLKENGDELFDNEILIK